MKRPPGSLPIRAGYYFFGIAVTVGVIFSLAQVAGALIASLLFSFLLAPVVNFAENRGIPRVAVVIGIYLIVAGLLVLIIMVVGPILSAEIVKLTRELPEYERQLADILGNLQSNIQTRMPGITVPDLYGQIKAALFSGEGFDPVMLLSRVLGVFSIVMILVIVPVITFFFIVDGHAIQKAVLRLVPNRYFEMCVLLLNRTGSALQSFIRGQLIDALYVGVMTTIGMAAVGLPYFVVIGMFAGVGNLIPYLGPVIGFIPAFFVALLTPGYFSAGSILLIAAIFVVVQLTESAFIYPLAIGKSVNLHPLIVILGIVIGGRFGGILGMLIAVPVISIVKVILEVSTSYLKSYRII